MSSATDLSPRCLRWCVTGTPIGRGGLEDVFGLVKVLGYKPYDDHPVFRCVGVGMGVGGAAWV